MENQPPHGFGTSIVPFRSGFWLSWLEYEPDLQNTTPNFKSLLMGENTRLSCSIIDLTDVGRVVTTFSSSGILLLADSSGKGCSAAKLDDEKFLLLQNRRQFRAPSGEFSGLRCADQDLPRLLFHEVLLRRVEPTAISIQDRESIGEMAEGDCSNTRLVLRRESGSRGRSITRTQQQ